MRHIKRKTETVSDFRVVVLFEDCCRKVELHMRYLKLQRILVEKIFELRSLESQEKRVLKGMETPTEYLCCVHTFSRIFKKLCFAE